MSITAPVDMAASDESDRSASVAIATLACFGVLLIPMNLTMVAVATVAISDAFKVGLGTVAALICFYCLAAGASQAVTARLTRGRQAWPAYRAGMAIVAVASLSAAAAPAFGFVLVGHLLLPVGASVASVAGLVLLRRVADSTPALGPVLERVLLAEGPAAVLAPAIGGLLVSMFGWRGVFAFNLVLAITAIVVGLRWLPVSLRASGAVALDGEAIRPRLPRFDLVPVTAIRDPAVLRAHALAALRWLRRRPELLRVLAHQVALQVVVFAVFLAVVVTVAGTWRFATLVAGLLAVPAIVPGLAWQPTATADVDRHGHFDNPAQRTPQILRACQYVGAAAAAALLLGYVVAAPDRWNTGHLGQVALGAGLLLAATTLARPRLDRSGKRMGRHRRR